MVGFNREKALSEVIGFILIIAIMMVIASLYMTYVVPAKGREAEIQHMTYVKNQFVDYKIALDSLWINGEENMAISRNLEMGTQGQSTQGQFVFLPLMNPAGSSGELAVSTGVGTGTVNITIGGFGWDGRTSFDQDVYQSLYVLGSMQNTVNVPISEYDTNYNRQTIPIMGIYPAYPISNPWNLSFYLSRDADFKPNGSWTIPPNQINSVNLVANLSYNLVMDLRKSGNSTPVFERVIIRRDVKLGDTIPVNLMDPAYGLDIYGPLVATNGTVTFSPRMQSGLTLPSPNMTASAVMESTEPQAMGSFSYQGNNYYWIPQRYSYQNGAIFLSQTDGLVVRVLPVIALTTVNNTPRVSVTSIRITGLEDSVSGTSPVQVVTRVTNITRNAIKSTIFSSEPDNVYFFKLSFDNLTPESVAQWKDTFGQILTEAVQTSGFNQKWVYISDDADSVVLELNNTTGIGKNYPCFSVDYTDVEVNIALQPVGWTG